MWEPGISKEFETVTVQWCRRYLQSQNESGYLLVDVRCSQDYASEHLPGAVLMPVAELPARLGELPLDRDLLFYCNNGRRSRTAATFVGGRPYQEGLVYHLKGGLNAWQGRTQSTLPNLRNFDLEAPAEKILYQAMDLERGAWNFYQAMLEHWHKAPIGEALQQLAEAEESHAHLIYGYWERLVPSPPGFHALYEAMPGSILEGGAPVDDLVAMLSPAQEAGCEAVMETALDLEYTAYDLYRSLAHVFVGQPLEKTLLSIAAAEKEHMRLAAESLRLCAPRNKTAPKPA